MTGLAYDAAWDTLVAGLQDATPAVHHLVAVSVEEALGGRTSADIVAEAYALGTEVTAICGHRWVPTRSPLGLPCCALCDELAP